MTMELIKSLTQVCLCALCVLPFLSIRIVVSWGKDSKAQADEGG